MCDLLELVLKSKESNKDAMLEIVNRFMPLIKKYSRKLEYDGSESDLIIAIIKLIQSYPNYNNISSEGEIVAYINTSIIHEYIRLSKINQKIIAIEIPLNDDIYLITTDADIQNMVYVNELLDKLPTRQSILLKHLFIDEYSEAHLAKKLNISRQAVNKNKNKALNNLKNILIRNEV